MERLLAGTWVTWLLSSLSTYGSSISSVTISLTSTRGVVWPYLLLVYGVFFFKWQDSGGFRVCFPCSFSLCDALDGTQRGQAGKNIIEPAGSNRGIAMLLWA